MLRLSVPCPYNASVPAGQEDKTATVGRDSPRVVQPVQGVHMSPVMTRRERISQRRAHCDV